MAPAALSAFRDWRYQRPVHSWPMHPPCVRVIDMLVADLGHLSSGDM